jgi:hypothetical protein
VFTLLALSIQTAKFGTSSIADIFELIGWVLLFISGISGLWRLEFLPVEREKLVMRDEYEYEYENKIIKVQQLSQSGVNGVHVLEDNEAQIVASNIHQYENAVNALNPLIKKLETSNTRKYQVHRYLFVAALLCLLSTQNIIASIIIC